MTLSNIFILYWHIYYVFQTHGIKHQKELLFTAKGLDIFSNVCKMRRAVELVTP